MAGNEPDGADPATTLRRRLHLLAFVDEFVPFAVLFTLWFDDNGVTVAQLSVVFVMWALASLALEVPTGLIADRVDRRRLLAGAFVIRLAGLVVWLLAPTFIGLLIGGALWAVHDAAASGAWEAMIHDQLEAIHAHHRYGIVMARVGQFGHGGTAVAALVSTPLLGIGLSLAVLGWLTIALQAATIVIVLSLPDVRWVVERARSEPQPPDHPLRVLARSRWIVAVVGVSALIGGLGIIDEYVPLLARRRGLADTFNPLVYLTVWIGLIVGGEIAARRPTLPLRTLSIIVVLGALAAVAGLTTGSVWTLGLIGFTYAAIEATWVIADARLQHEVRSHVRATVTSVREFGASVVSAVALAGIAWTSSGGDPSTGLVVVAVTLAAAGVGLAMLPNHRPMPTSADPRTLSSP